MNTTDSLAVAEHVKRAVLAMPMARTLGLSFVRLGPGEVELEVPVSDAFCFRPGQLQATAVFAAADFAAVAAAATLLKPGWANATIDATLKIVAPARGRCLRARGRVVHVRRRGLCGRRRARDAVRDPARHRAQPEHRGALTRPDHATAASLSRR
jgi:acyl-coenzyme A thioesterase PaaI-like protein